MGTLSGMADRNLSPERARLVEAAKRSRYTLRELSTALGRNPSYLQQFIVKGSPRALPEDVRHRLAEMLHLSEADLRSSTDRAPVPPLPLAAIAPMPEDPSVLAPKESPSRGDRTTLLPLVPESRIGETALPGSLFPVSALSANVPSHAVAVTLEREHGIFQPRHILICDPPAAARIGDVAVVRAPSCRTTIGLLIGGAKGTITVREGAEDHTLPAETAVIWRMLAVRLDQ